ncbi:hypothetical protein [Cellulomonas fengjieae]|uniref:hypothetical protein n=1 Tax=Cellulomonas fengjieae TaxID=2819978 RepID=UPI001AAEC089|nr:hypothetical protein [Cellulomonas fengjieae]MBO3102218.1 hypothetical protein [Cellulomonas fengjieae]
MANYRARRVPDHGGLGESELLAGPFEADDEATALRIGNAAVRRTHLLHRGSDYRLERLSPTGEWEQVAYLDTTGPGLDGVPHQWVGIDRRGESDTQSSKDGSKAQQAMLQSAIRDLDARPPEEVRQHILGQEMISPALDTVVDLARHAESPEIRAEARALLESRGLSLLLAVAEDGDIIMPDGND